MRKFYEGEVFERVINGVLYVVTVLEVDDSGRILRYISVEKEGV